MRKSMYIAVACFLLSLIFLAGNCNAATKTTKKATDETTDTAKLTKKQKKEQKFVKKYFKDDGNTKQVVIVEYEGGSDATLSFHEKKDGIWKKVFSTPAYVGKNGIDKEKEGDYKTPTGTFDMKLAFGIQPDPGTKLPYTKLTDTMYWCGDKEYYNQFVDTSKLKDHKECDGEHLIEYTKAYQYVMAIDYNSDCVYKKGAAIFLHCYGDHEYTAGCVSIPEKKMIELLKKSEEGIKIVIAKKATDKKTDTTKLTKKQKKEQKFVKKYLKDDNKTEQVVIVKYKSGSDATLSFHEKEDGIWKKVFSTPAYVGKNGIDKEKEGDYKTPTGTFDMKLAFGIQPNPGTKLPYTKVTDTMYWCGDKEYYNQFVDTSKLKDHKECDGEHLIEYKKAYEYAMAIDYNSDCVYQKGSAIFLHCYGDNEYTAGCVSIPEKKMVELLKAAKKGIKIVIQ